MQFFAVFKPGEFVNLRIRLYVTLEVDIVAFFYVQCVNARTYSQGDDWQVWNEAILSKLPRISMDMRKNIFTIS